MRSWDEIETEKRLRRCAKMREVWARPGYRAARKRRRQQKELLPRYALLVTLLKENHRTRSRAVPNKLEKLFDGLTPQNVRFVGDGSFWIDLPNGRRKNPDFKVIGEDKVIELFGDRWHRHLRYTDPEALIELCWRAGIECLVIWESEFHQRRDEMLALVAAFVARQR